MRRVAAALGGVALAIGLLVLLPATPAAACSCAMPEPVTDETLADYDVAFTGEVTANELDRSRGRRTFSVAVAEVFKGEAGADARVVTPDTGAACGTDATVGTEVLFLMTYGPTFGDDRLADDDELVVMSCGGHRHVGEAEDLAAGRPATPAQDPVEGPVEAPDDDLGGDTSVVAVIGLAVVGAAALLAVVWVVTRRRAGGGDPA